MKPKPKKLPFVAAFIVLAAVFGITLWDGIQKGHAGAWQMIGFGIVVIGGGLLYWFKLRKPPTPPPPAARSGGPGSPLNRPRP